MNDVYGIKESDIDDVVNRVDAWLKQGDAFKEALRRRRQQILAELADVEGKLSQLGVDVKGEDREQADFERQNETPESYGGNDDPDLNTTYRVVIGVVNRKPQKVAAIMKKACVTKKEALDALRVALANGVVKRSGVGAAFWTLT